MRMEMTHALQGHVGASYTRGARHWLCLLARQSYSTADCRPVLHKIMA